MGLPYATRSSPGPRLLDLERGLLLLLLVPETLLTPLVGRSNPVPALLDRLS